MSTYISSLSNSDHSLHLSEGSTSSSKVTNSTHKTSMTDKKKKKTNKKSPTATPTTITLSLTTQQLKKTTRQIKDEPLYCICRQGYDGKQFMIACDTCHEWFHGQCVGINPKSVIKNYYCDACKEKPTKKKTTTTTTTTTTLQDSKITNGKGRGKKKATPTTNRKKSTTKVNSTSLSTPLPPSPLPSQQSTTITTNAAQDDDDDDDLDDICPICEFECTCGTSTVSIPTPAPTTPQPVTVTSLDTQTTPSPRKGTIKKQPKKQSAKSRKGKSAKKNIQFVPLSDDEDVDILDDDDDALLSPTAVLDDDDDDDDDGDSLVMDPFSSDQELSSDEEDQMDNLSPYPDSQLGSYSSSIHIDSGDDDEDIEQEEERAIIAEMMEHDLSDNTLDDKNMDGNGYFIEDEDSDDLDDYDMDDSCSDASDGDLDLDLENDDDDEAHAYYLRTNGLWASSEEEDDEEEEEEDLGFHSDPGPLHDASDDDDPTDLVSLLGGADSTLFNNIAEAFMHVLAPLADINHSEGITPTHSTVTPISALSSLNVATFDLGSNAAACLNSAPTSPIGHRLDDYLRRPSLPSNALLAAANGHREMDLASDALSALSSVLSAETLDLPLHHTTTNNSNTNENTPANERELESTRMNEQPALSTASSSSSSSSPPATSSTVYESATALASITPPDNYTESSPPSPAPSSQERPSSLDLTSLTSPSSPQPSYDLASLLPSDMKIPEQLLELIKSSLAASINEKPSTPNSSTTKPGSSSSSSSSSSSNRQLLPKLTPNGIGLSTESDKKRPLSIVTQLSKKRARSDEEDEVSMDELLDTSQLDARPEEGTTSSDATEDRFARDLSRWERVPIGAFRLMRSKNRLWLNR